MGLPGRAAHRETGLFGSASMIVTVAPLSASCVARMTAAVDFPTPPFGEAMTTTGIAPPPPQQADCSSYLIAGWIPCPRKQVDSRQPIRSKLLSIRALPGLPPVTLKQQAFRSSRLVAVSSLIGRGMRFGL